MNRFSKSEMQKAANIIRKQLKESKGHPASITLKNMEGKNVKVSKAYYNGLFEAQNVFIRNHGRLPNYVTLNSKANNPLVMDYQDTSYTCGPTSFSMATQLLFDNISEEKCAKVLGTTKNGTSPSDLVANAPKLGYKVTAIKRNYSAVKSSLEKGFAVIAHIETKPATCLGFKNNYGHFVLVYDAYSKLLTKYYRVACPTKGLKVCKSSILDKATNGRDIKYYKVGLV